MNSIPINCGCDLDNLTCELEKHIVKIGKALYNSLTYDVDLVVDLDEAYLFRSYLEALSNKKRFHSDCFNTINKETICSKILTLLYR